MKNIIDGVRPFVDCVLARGAKLSSSKDFGLYESIKTFVCNFFKGKLSKVDNGKSHQFTHDSLLSTVRLHAFTLAETLIVMGVIGVVAALTIPNMSRDTSNVEKVARFKKLYAELTNAHEQAVIAYGPVDGWFKGTMCENGIAGNNSMNVCAQRYFGRLTEFMKVTKTCKQNVYTEVECMTKRLKYELHNTTGQPYRNSYDIASAILPNGASFSTRIMSPSCENSYCGYINLDIDGPKKGKNTYGIDLFQLKITEKGILPGTYTSSQLRNDPGRCFHYGDTCGQWIMDFGNMDYINASHEAPTGICNNDNSKQLGWANNKAHSCK